MTLSAPTPHEAVKAREEDIKSHPVTPPKPPNKKLSPASDSKKKPVERDHPHQNNEMAPSSSSQGCSTTKEQSENSSTCSSRTRTPAKANLTMKKSGSGSGEDGATLLTGPPTPSVSPSPPLSSSPPPIHVLSIPECSTQSTPPPPHPVVAVAAGSGALLPTSPVVVHRRTEGGNAIATANSSGEEQKKAEAMVPSGSATAGTESKPPLTLVLAPGPEESERLLASQTNTTTTPNTASPHQKPPRPVSNGLGGRSRQRSSNANSIAHSFVNALQRLDSFDPQQKISDAEELQRQCEAVNSSSNGGAPPLPASISTSTPHMLLSDLIGGLESPPPPSACGGGCNSSMGSLGLRASSAPRTTFSAGGGAGGLMSSQRMNSMMRIPSFNSSSRSWVIDNKGELRSSSSDLSVFSCGSVDVQEFLTDFKQAKVQCLKEKQQLISLDDLVMILDNVNVPLPDITLLSDLFDELRLPPRGVPMVLEKPQAPPPPPINNTNNTNNNSGSVSNGINSNSNINGNSVNSVLNASQKKHNNPTSTAPPPPPPPMIPSNPTTLPTSNSGTTGSGSSKPSSQKSNEVRGPLIRPSCADEYSASSGVHHNNLRNNANSNNTSHNNNNNANAGGGGGGTLSTSASFPVVQMTDGGVTKPLAPSSSHSTMSTDYPTTGGNGGSNMNAMVSSGAGGARLTPNNGGAGGGVAARSLGIGGSSSPLWVTLDDAALVEEEEDPGDGTEGEERVEFQTFLARMAFMIHGRYPQEVIRSVFYAMVEDMDRGRIRVSVKGKDWLDSTFTAFPLYGGVSTASLDKADMAQFGVVGSGGGAGGASHAPRESTDGTVRAGGGLPPLYSHTPISPSSPVVLSSACSSPPTASSPDPMATTTSPGVAESVLRPNILSSIPTTGPRAAVDMGNANHHPSNSNSGDTASGGLDELGEATATATNFLHLSRTMPLYLCVMDGIYRRLGMRQFTGVHVQQALRAAHLPDDDLQWECHVNDFVAVVQALTQIVQPLTTTSTMSGGFAMASCAGGQASSPYLWPTAASSATSSRSGGRPPTQNFTSSFL